MSATTRCQSGFFECVSPRFGFGFKMLKTGLLFFIHFDITRNFEVNGITSYIGAPIKLSVLLWPCLYRNDVIVYVQLALLT